MLKSLHKSSRWIVSLALLFALVAGSPSVVNAGCGCDHPPPAWAPVMPIFAPVGESVTLHPKGRVFIPGHSYKVTFNNITVPGGVVAEKAGALDVVVPKGLPVGPTFITVTHLQRGWFGIQFLIIDAIYGFHEFTVLPAFATVPARRGVYQSVEFPVAVDMNGTVLLPLDLSMVADSTQFAFQFKKLGFAFGNGDVTFYSKDGADLTLFTLAVDDSTEREWGSYYGWEVDDDSEISGYRYENKFARARDLVTSSNILTYWRHEFHSYAKAHLPGGSHEIDENGFHPDGTLHIEHDRIVLAIRGQERNFLFPDLEHLNYKIFPGRRNVRLNVAVEPSENPVEPMVMIPMVEDVAPTSLEEEAEYEKTYIWPALLEAYYYSRDMGEADGDDDEAVDDALDDGGVD